jgi:hypothetical protein
MRKIFFLETIFNLVIKKFKNKQLALTSILFIQISIIVFLAYISLGSNILFNREYELYFKLMTFLILVFFGILNSKYYSNFHE